MHNDGNVKRLQMGLCGIVPHYEHAPVTLCGVRLTDYRIAYAEANTCFEKTLAEGLAARIADLSKDVLAWGSDAELERSERLILLLGGNREGAVLEMRGSVLVLGGANAYEMGLAVRAFLEMLEASVVRGDGVMTVEGEIPVAEHTSLGVMAYNFYGFHAYQTRMDNICRIITKYLPDVLAIQEPDLAMMALTHVNLDAYYDYYNGTPRHGNDDETPPADAKGANSVAPILYNRARLRLVSADTKWMSDTPNKVSKYAESEYYRHFTYAQLEDRVTGRQFVAVNLHLQRRTGVEQVKIVLEHMTRLYPNLPVLFVGDFNNEADTPTLRMLREAAGFASVHDTAKKIRDGHNRIDWILYTADSAEAEFYHCCTETYPDPDDKKGYYHGRTPSDHFAFYGEITLNDRAVHHDWSALADWEAPKTE